MSALAVASLSAVDGPDVPTLHLKIGTLDGISTGLLRHVLSRGEQPGAHIVADLRQADDTHELTLFALLAAKRRAVADAAGLVTAVRPTLRLSHLLGSIGVTVTHELPLLAGLTSLEIVTVGQLLDRGLCEGVDDVLSDAELVAEARSRRAFRCGEVPVLVGHADPAGPRAVRYGPAEAPTVPSCWTG